MRVKTANKRAEMWTSMRGWLENGAIPDDDALATDLTGVEYGYSQDDKILLEKKEHMKARGLASPDDADALALTFAAPVMPRSTLYWPNDPQPRQRELSEEEQWKQTYKDLWNDG
jgi:hypothetical protein